MGYLKVCCLISKYLGLFQLFFLLLISSLIQLWSENIICMISSILYVLGCVLHKWGSIGA